MRRIDDIYREHKIVPALQLHMLRVAAVASMICDNFDRSLPKEDIISACLLHDMGNIIKSKFEVFPEFWLPEGVDYWKGVQEEFFSKYGTDDHLATESIAKEVGVSDRVLAFVNHIGFSNAIRNDLENVFEHKICNYSDMRVGPHGVIPMQDRIQEAHKRYQGRNHDIGQKENFEKSVNSLINIEQQIFANCKIKPEDITEEAVQKLIPALKEFVIK
jgi:hypothetical protein